ncbi:MAG: TetR/AcrR family transcriptional regulator [Oscillospiraceae bacterium]|nr:TetR/AcrR family transcriptional regulator [Oscillospiraceae bacterium]
MKKYSEKEMIIFSGVIKLAKSGVPLTEITARQIAEAAGIGKATIYDYFSSKEEILVHAMVYALQQQLEITNSRLEEIDSFKGKMTYIYNDIIDKAQDSFSAFSFISSIGGPEKIRSFFNETGHCRMVNETLKGIGTTMAAVLEYGRQTGVISVTDKEYSYMVVSGNISAVSAARTEKRFSREKICETAYKMLVKSMN